MIIRTFPRDLTPEDRVTHAAWVRWISVLYGCALLLLLGLLFVVATPDDERANTAAAPAVFDGPTGNITGAGRRAPTP